MSPREAVRKRPGMYIGEANLEGYFQVLAYALGACVTLVRAANAEQGHRPHVSLDWAIDANEARFDFDWEIYRPVHGPDGSINEYLPPKPIDADAAFEGAPDGRFAGSAPRRDLGIAEALSETFRFRAALPGGVAVMRDGRIVTGLKRGTMRPEKQRIRCGFRIDRGIVDTTGFRHDLALGFVAAFAKQDHLLTDLRSIGWDAGRTGDAA